MRHNPVVMGLRCQTGLPPSASSQFQPTYFREPTPTASSAPAPAKPAARTHSVQNQAIAAYITDSLTTLNAALGTPEIASLLASRGYTAEEIQRGLALQTAAQKAFSDQLPSIAASRSATAALREKINAAREIPRLSRHRPCRPPQAPRPAARPEAVMAITSAP